MNVAWEGLKLAWEHKNDYKQAYEYNLEPDKKFEDYNIEEQAAISEDHFFLKKYGEGIKDDLRKSGIDIKYSLQELDEVVPYG